MNDLPSHRCVEPAFYTEIVQFEQFKNTFYQLQFYLSIHFLIPFASIVLHFAAFCTKCFGYAVRAPKIIIKSSIQIMLIQYFTCLLLLETTSNSGWYILPLTFASHMQTFQSKGVQTCVQETSFALGCLLLL